MNQEAWSSQASYPGLETNCSTEARKWKMLHTQKAIQIPTATGNPIDPFGTSCLKIDKTIHDLLQYYVRVSHADIWFPEPVTPLVTKSTFQHDANSIIRNCLSDEMKMYSILSNMASQLHIVQHRNLPQSAEFFIHKAVIATQRKISSQPLTDQSILYWLFHLRSAEWYQSNYEATMIHFQGMKAICDRLGGTSTLDQGLQTLIAVSDVFNAGTFLLPPVFPCNYDPGDAPYLEQFGLQERFDSELATNLLLSHTYRPIVPTELYEPVKGLIVYAFLRENAVCRLPAARQNADLARWMHLRSLAMIHRLLSLQLEDQRSMAIAVGVCIWFNLFLPVAACSMLAKAMAVRLSDRIKAGTANWVGYEEVLLWIQMIGAMATNNQKIAQDSYLRGIVNSAKYGDGGRLFKNNTINEERLQVFMEEFSPTKALGPKILELSRRIQDLMHKDLTQTFVTSLYKMQ